MKASSALLVAAIAGAAPATAAAGTVRGSAFDDADGDGLFSAGEEGVAGVRIAWEGTFVATTAADGSYSFEAPDEEGIAWARTPDGFRPGPRWHRLDGGGDEDDGVDFALRRAGAPGADLTFVVGSDSHMGRKEFDVPGELDADDLALALRQAIDLDPAPGFVAITGDIAQSNRPDQFARTLEVVQELDIAFVPVPGNHDWFDGGASYRETFGPPMYSFEAGGARFVVLNDNDPVPAWQAFLLADLADAPAEARVVAFMHRPPEDEELAVLEAAGVDTLFTGHWHSNAVFTFGDLVQYNTEPIVRGGVDGTPAGYRVVSFTGGVMTLSHHAVVDSPTLRVTYPRADDCVAGDTTPVLVAAQLGARFANVDASLGGAEARLGWNGAWSYTGELPVPRGDDLTLRVTARSGSGAALESEVHLRRCEAPAPGAGAVWSQVQGDAHHRGFAPDPIAPPLATAWARSIGAHIHGGSPILAGGRLFVVGADFSDGATSVVVALDAVTGAELWRASPGVDLRNAPAIAGEVLVVPASSGLLVGYHAATGEELWRHDVGAGVSRNRAVLHAAVATDGSAVYAGVHGRYAALAAESGHTVWEGVPGDGRSMASLAAAAVAGGLVIGTVGRGREGLFAWDAVTGLERWRIGAPATIGVQGSPIASEDDARVYFVNAAGVVHAVELATGDEVWQSGMFSGNTDWDYAVTATPALAHGLLFVPTTYDWFVALDAATGDEAWRIRARESVLHVSHARTTASSFSAAPLVTGSVLWIAGADGFLRAHDAVSGDELWCSDLAAPLLSGMAAGDGALYVGSFDGTIRALTPVEGELGCQPVVAPPAPDIGDCGCRSGGPPRNTPATFLLVVAAAVFARRRRPGRRTDGPFRSGKAH
ncbi:MAG TPA: PQQ-binding-like beta-propeller repeat protein [Kofleriaceae bacterium]|nr:PQQ-binding-like beta-propeller repeat protein [Kofleriaceae bacterium]